MPNTTENKKKAIVDDLIGKIEMSDASEKRSDSPCIPDPCCSSKEPYYPSLYLDSKQAPGLKGYDVKETVYLLVEADIVGHSIRESEKNSNESFDLKIKKIGCSPKKTK